MLRIKHLIFKRLGKTDLDVLENAAENVSHTYVAMGRHRDWFVELAGYPLAWERRDQSDYADLELAAVPGREEEYPAQELTIRIQHGEREGETRLNQLRSRPILTLSNPVRDRRPPEDTAYLVLLRDERDVIHARYVATIGVFPQNLRERIRAEGKWGSLEFAEEGGIILDDPLLGRVLHTLERRFNVILYGPPGTGKTWLMQRVKRAFESGIAPVLFDPTDLAQPFKQEEQEFLAGRDNKETRFVTFHQSTSYETFVAGLTPAVGEKGNLEYKVEEGPLLELANHALNEGGASLLLIDEINRGNTAEILGELITVLEPEKRLDENGAAHEYTVEVSLPYVPRGSASVVEGRFRMPYHFYIVGSMNSVDRTVAPLDSALRRRFQIIEVPPDLDLIRRRAREIEANIDVDTARQEWRHLAFLAHQLLEKINRYIAVIRGPDFQLGHAYLWDIFHEGLNINERREWLIESFAHRILPQVREMFRDQPDELRLLLGGDANEGSGRLFTHDIGPVELQSSLTEPVGWLRFHPPVESDTETWIDILRAVAEVEPGQSWKDDTAEELVDQENADEIGAPGLEE